jgi:hypothetical protein
MEMKIGQLSNKCQTVSFEIRSTSGRSPHYIEGRVVPVEVKFNEFKTRRPPRIAEVDHIITPRGAYPQGSKRIKIMRTSPAGIDLV